MWDIVHSLGRIHWSGSRTSELCIWLILEKSRCSLQSAQWLVSVRNNLLSIVSSSIESDRGWIGTENHFVFGNPVWRNQLKAYKCVSLNGLLSWGGGDFYFQAPRCGSCKEKWFCCGRNCYYFSQEWLTWEESVKSCHSKDSSLVKIDDNKELVSSLWGPDKVLWGAGTAWVKEPGQVFLQPYLIHLTETCNFTGGLTFKET